MYFVNINTHNTIQTYTNPNFDRLTDVRSSFIIKRGLFDRMMNAHRIGIPIINNDFRYCCIPG